MATNAWTGGAGNGLWASAGNWSLARAPDGTDDVVLTGSSHITGVNADCLSLTATAFTGNLEMSSEFIIVHGGNVALSTTMTLTTVYFVMNGGTGPTSSTSSTLKSGGHYLAGLEVDIGTLTILDDVTTEYMETRHGTTAFDFGTHTLTIGNTFDQDGIFIDAALAVRFNLGAKLVFAPVGAIECSVFMDGAVTPCFPPIEINATGGGTAKLYDGNIDCDTLTTVAGSWIPNGNTVVLHRNTWTGGAANGLWATAGNWSLGAKPTNVHCVVIAGSTAITGAQETCLSLDVTSYTGTLTMSGGLIDVWGGDVRLGSGMTLVTTGFNMNTGGISAATSSRFTSVGIEPVFVRVDAGTLTLVDSLKVSSYFELSAANVAAAIGANTLTIEAHADGDGLYLDDVNAWSWSTGGKIVIKTTGAQAAVIFVDGATTPWLPPIEIDATAGGSVTLNDGNLDCQSFKVIGGSWNLNGHSVITHDYATAVQAGFWG